MKSKPAKGKTKEIVMKPDRRLFGNMVPIVQSRKPEMRDVLSHRPLPWALSNGDGIMTKTNKAVLSKHLESKVLPVENSQIMCSHKCSMLATDVVFDVYKAESTKSAERIQRGSTEGISFSNTMPGAASIMH